MYNFKVYPQDDNFVFEEVVPICDVNGPDWDFRTYWDWNSKNNIFTCKEEDLPNLICMTYQGELVPYVCTWDYIKGRLADEIMAALETEGYYSFTDYALDPDDPYDKEETYEWRIYHPKVILLPKK